MKGTKGMEGMKHDGPAANPAARKAACDQLKNASPADPLTQALEKKCRSQGKTGAAQGNDRSGDSVDQHTKPATGSPSDDGQPAPSGDQHH
jgi:hypothetical protein